MLASGLGVSFSAVPDFHGPIGVALMFARTLAKARTLVRGDTVFILRSGHVSSVLWLLLVARGRPYAKEVPGDYAESVAALASRASAGVRVAVKIASHAVRSLERQQVRPKQAPSAYVSPSLQVLYPPGDEMLAHVCSNVVLPDFVSAAAGRVLHTDDEARLVSVGRLEPEKGHLVLLEALSILAVRDDVPRVRATLVGAGSEDAALERARRNWAPACWISRARSPKERRSRDLSGLRTYSVLPSLTEGMPRALIEAMAVGVPVVATSAGGVSDVLPESWLVEPGNPVALADAIQVLLSSRHRREERAKMGRQPAYARFSDEQLMAARRNFWIATCAGGSA